jgi:hypothetical protein
MGIGARGGRSTWRVGLRPAARPRQAGGAGWEGASRPSAGVEFDDSPRGLAERSCSPSRTSPVPGWRPHRGRRSRSLHIELERRGSSAPVGGKIDISGVGGSPPIRHQIAISRRRSTSVRADVPPVGPGECSPGCDRDGPKTVTVAGRGESTACGELAENRPPPRCRFSRQFGPRTPGAARPPRAWSRVSPTCGSASCIGRPMPWSVGDTSTSSSSPASTVSCAGPAPATWPVRVWPGDRRRPERPRAWVGRVDRHDCRARPSAADVRRGGRHVPALPAGTSATR